MRSSRPRAIIPAERLTAYQRWELAGVLEPEVPPALPEPPPPPPPPEPEYKWPTAEELDQIHQEGHRQGYAAGYEEGTARVRMEAMHVHGLVETLGEAVEKLESSMADGLLQLAIEIARQVVRRALEIDTESVLPVVREALEALPEQQITIHVNPDDMAVIKQHLGDLAGHGELRVVRKADIERGGCVLETGNSQLDATVGTRWKRIVEGMGSSSDWHVEPAHA